MINYLPPSQTQYSAVEKPQTNLGKPLVVELFKLCQKQEPKPLYCELPDDLFKVHTTSTSDMSAVNATVSFSGTVSTTTT